MSLPQKTRTSNDYAEQVDAFFHVSMDRMRLTRAQIEHQDLAELRRSMAMVEDALARADSFGMCKIRVTATVSVLVKASSDAHFEIGITPLLLEAKSLVMSRLQELGADSPETERSILRQQSETYRRRWLLTTGVVLWAVGCIGIWRIPHLMSWSSFTSHNNYAPLASLSSIALAGLVWALLDSDPARRKFAFGSVALAAVLAGAALL